VQAKNGADKKRIANQSSRVQVRKIALISKKFLLKQGLQM
jgi:hypothetical protein